MKNLILVIFALFSLSAFSMEADVISAEFQVENELEQKTLCLTVVRIPATGELLGIVEDIYDCYYARQARKSPHLPLEIDEKLLSPIQNELLERLQRQDTQLRFFFSEGE